MVRLKIIAFKMCILINNPKFVYNVEEIPKSEVQSPCEVDIFQQEKIPMQYYGIPIISSPKRSIKRSNNK